MLVVEKGKCREERWYNYTPVAVSRRQERRRSDARAAGPLQGRGQAAPAQRRAGRHPAERRPRFRPAACADERTRQRLAGLHGGLRRVVRGRRAGRRRRNGAAPRRPAHSGAARSRRVRAGVADDRRLPRGADRLVVDRADVLRLPARARGRQGRAHRPGAGRAVLRLQAPPRRPLRRHLAKAAEPASGR